MSDYIKMEMWGVKQNDDDEEVGCCLYERTGEEGNKGRRRYRLEFGGRIAGKIETQRTKHNSKQAKQTKKIKQTEKIKAKRETHRARTRREKQTTTANSRQKHQKRTHKRPNLTAFSVPHPKPKTHLTDHSHPPTPKSTDTPHP